MFQPASSSPC